MPLGTEVGLGRGDIVLDGDPAPPLPAKGAQQPPTFRLLSIVAKRSLISATAELLFKIRRRPTYFNVFYFSLRKPQYNALRPFTQTHRVRSRADSRHYERRHCSEFDYVGGRGSLLTK